MNINITSYVNQLGYGIAGLNIVKAFARAGHSPALWINGPGQVPAEDGPVVAAAVERTARYDPTAPSLRIAHQWDMVHHAGRGPRLGLTFFEADRLRPNEVHHLKQLDCVLSPSAWGASVLCESGLPQGMIGYAPLGVDMNVFHPAVLPALPAGHENAACLEGATVFLSCGKWELRKGHDLICTAFCRAFSPGERVALIMNCQNPFLSEQENGAWEKMYTTSPMGGQILVVRDRLRTQREVAALMALADCGVFPARAEGWGLEALEMLALGKHVIATDYSAHREFLNDANACLLGVSEKEPAFDGVFFKDGHGEWARLGETHVARMAEYMRSIHLMKQERGCVDNPNGVATARHFSWDNTVQEIINSL